MKNLLLVLGEMACDLQGALERGFGDFSVLQNCQKQDCQTIILHPIADARYDEMQIQYEIGAELGVATLLANAVLKSEILANATFSDAISSQSATNAESLKQIFDKLSSFDFGHISSESALSDEELECIMSDFKQAQNRFILLGRAFACHSDKELIYKILGLLSKSANVQIIASSDFATLDFGATLENDFFDKLESRLENLPESNGAFVYIAPQNAKTAKSNPAKISESKTNTPKIQATKQFLALAKSQNGDTITLKNPMQDFGQNLQNLKNPNCQNQIYQNQSCQNLSFEIVEATHLRGVVGIVRDFGDTHCYPFIPLKNLIA